MTTHYVQDWAEDLFNIMELLEHESTKHPHIRLSSEDIRSLAIHLNIEKLTLEHRNENVEVFRDPSFQRSQPPAEKKKASDQKQEPTGDIVHVSKSGQEYHRITGDPGVCPACGQGTKKTEDKYVPGALKGQYDVFQCVMKVCNWRGAKKRGT